MQNYHFQKPWMPAKTYMKNILLIFILIFFIHSVFIAQQSSTVQQVTVKVILSKNKIQAGSNLKHCTQLKINNEWHINSHTPTFDYLIGTTFELKFKEGIILSNVQYPKSKLVSLSFADQPIDVYQGTITIFATLRISDKLNPGIDTLKRICNFPGLQ